MCFRRVRCLVPTVLVAVLSMACAGQRYEIVGGGKLVREVRLEGVHRFSKEKVLNHLFAGETSSWFWGDDAPFDEALLSVDRARLRELYAAYGYHKAQVVEIRAIPVEGKPKVELLIRVDEGQVTKVSRITFNWATAPASDGLKAKVESFCPLSVGGAFEVPRMNDCIGNLRQALLVSGYPLARTSAKAQVQESAGLAELAFSLEPGEAASIGKVSFEGLVLVPERPVGWETEFAVGRPFSPMLLRQLEEAVKSMRVFRSVTARTVEKVVDGRIDVIIKVSEADPQRLHLGTQISVETIRWQEQLVADYTHTNLFGNLTRLDLRAIIGWAQIPNPWDPFLQGPVFSLEPKFTRKGLLEKHLVWSLTPGFDMNLQEGYQYYSPRNRFGVDRWFLGWLHLSVSHNLQAVNFFNMNAKLDKNASLLGRDFRDPYLLSFMELGASAFFADSIGNPRNGVILETTAALAGGPFGGNFDHRRLDGGVRAYWRPASRIQLASQLKTGMIMPYGSSPGAPIIMKYYLGGPNTLRGWGARRLSPRLCDATGCTIPIGGYTMVQGNLELRFRAAGPLWLVGFVDMGDVQAADLTWVTSEWNYSAGPGLRYQSPLGLVRLDAGFRLNDPGGYPGEPAWGIYFGLGEAF